MKNYILGSIVLALLCVGLPDTAAAQSACDQTTRDQVNRLYERMGTALQNNQFDVAISSVRQLKSFAGRCDVISAEMLEGLVTGFEGMRDNPHALRAPPCNPLQTGPYSYSC